MPTTNYGRTITPQEFALYGQQPTGMGLFQQPIQQGIAQSHQTYDPMQAQVDQMQLARKQKLADALREQSDKEYQQQTAGGYVVPYSPFQGLEKLFAAYSSKNMDEQIEAKQKEIEQAKNQKIAEILRRYEGKSPSTMTLADQYAIAKMDSDAGNVLNKRIEIDEKAADRMAQLKQQQLNNIALNEWRMQMQREAPPKAAPGTQVVKTPEGGYETIILPGSPQFLKAKSDEAADRSAVLTNVSSFEKNLKDIEDLKDDPALESIVGYANTYTPNLTPSARAAQVKLKQIENAMETAGLQLNKAALGGGSVGSMQLQEWDKMKAYFTKFDTATDLDTMKTALDNAATVYRRMIQRAKDSYQNEWTGSKQFGTDIEKELARQRAALEKEQRGKPNATGTITKGKSNIHDQADAILRGQ